MTDPKHAPRPEGSKTPQVASYIRPHDADPVAVPPPPLAPDVPVDTFFDDWLLHHFIASVKLHDAERVSEGNAEAMAVLDDASIVQGVLLELHEFAKEDPRVRARMDATTVLQNGVSALYRWLDDVLDAAGARGIVRRRPSFVDHGEESLVPILGALERVHPDLEALVALEGIDEDVQKKLGLCFRQIGAAIVRVSGRAGPSIPPPR